MSEDDVTVDAPLGTVDPSTGLRWWKYGDDYYVTLDRERLLILAFRDLRRSRDGGGPVAQVTATEQMRRVGWAPLTLGSGTSRTSYARACTEPIPADRLMDACFLVSELFRDGEPAAPLVSRAPTPDEWLMPQWIPRRNITVLYGDGGAHKSRLAIALAVNGLHKLTLPGWPIEPIQGGVLYLDWETNRETHEFRLWRYLRPANLTDPPGLIYRKMFHPLTEDIRRTRELVDEHRAELVIVDSFALASGGEGDGWSDMSTRTFDALQTLKTTSIVINHIPKSAATGSTIPPPWGSIFNQNIPRSTIFCAKTDTDDKFVKLVTATHIKSNEGATMDPVGLKFIYDADGYYVIQSAEASADQAPVPVRICRLLRDRGRLPASLIAEMLNLPIKTVKAALYKLKVEGKCSSWAPENADWKPGTPGRGREVLWGLIDRFR
jgi:hypothetical protein